jgi:hypothetical protein
VKTEIVVFLRAGLGHIDAVHVAVPAADVDLVGDVGRVKGGAEDGGVVLVDGLFGNAAEEMEAEFQAVGMEVVGDGLEGAGVLGEREAVGGRVEAAVFVGDQDGALAVLVGVGERLVPLDVDGDQSPAVGFEVFVDVVGVGEGLFFGDAGAVAVPGIPAHGRG